MVYLEEVYKYHERLIEDRYQLCFHNMPYFPDQLKRNTVLYFLVTLLNWSQTGD